MKQFTKFTAALLLFMATYLSRTSATNFLLSRDYKVTIHGTSNVHDWDETVGNVSGSADINWDKDGNFELPAMTIRMEVRSIKSEMGTAMDKNTYKALKADNNPQITFILASPLTVMAVKPGGTMITARGSLTIAGVTRTIDMQLKVSMPQPGKLIFEGVHKIKMTDFGIKPPTALLGTMKTGNDLTINFKVGL